MTFGTERRKSSSGYDHRRLPPNARQRAWRGATLVCVAALCAWTLCSTLADTGADQRDLARTRGDKLDVGISRGDKLDVAVSRGDRLVALNPTAPPSHFHVSLFDPHSTLGLSTETFANSASLSGDDKLSASRSSLLPSQTTARNTPDIRPAPSRDDQIAQKMVLPIPRPASAPPRDSLAASTQGNQSAKPSIFATIFQKLFGKREPVKLAYAASDDVSVGVGELAAGRYDQWTAVYDISAHIVYMPDGTQLEAHSGLGSLLDDPSHVDERMHGATPPNVYDLQLREELFHGVRALRMIPEDERKVFGRAGLLAHTFMLGPNGDSNGCVSIRNYDAFLQAYLDHKIKRLAVVASL
jgi:type VI secretion system (T6SS) effector TldE1-like protein